MMISDHLQTLTTWQVIQAGENAVRIASPFTYGDDGACITFSIFQPSPNSFFLSDDGASIMQAAIFGTEMDKKSYYRSTKQQAYTTHNLPKMAKSKHQEAGKYCNLPYLMQQNLP